MSGGNYFEVRVFDNYKQVYVTIKAPNILDFKAMHDKVLIRTIGGKTYDVREQHQELAARLENARTYCESNQKKYPNTPRL